MSINTETIRLSDIQEARKKIKDRIHFTPVFHSAQLGKQAGTDLYFKCENLQKTGSFKVRGVLNKLLSLDESAKSKGVVTVSAGNHAQALAWAATAAGINSKVVMPETAPLAKVNACKGYGAEVLLKGNVFDAFEKALAIEKEEGRTFIHPFEDPLIITGHGTAGLEIMEQVSDISTIVIGIGGGAICTGIAAAVKQIDPSIKVYGVEPEGAASMRKSFDAGKAVRLEKVETIADGLGSPMAGELTYALAREFVDDVIVVTDKEIASAMAKILSFTKVLAEPAGAAATAAVLQGKIPLPENSKTLCLISGGNIDLSRACEYFSWGE